MYTERERIWIDLSDIFCEDESYLTIVAEKIMEGLSSTLTLNLLTFSDMLSMLLTIYIIIGIGIGAIGSAISMRKYLDV